MVVRRTGASNWYLSVSDSATVGSKAAAAVVTPTTAAAQKGSMMVGALTGWLAGSVATALTVTLLAAPLALGQQTDQRSEQTLASSHPSDAAELAPQPADVKPAGSTILKSAQIPDTAQASPAAVVPVAATVNLPANATVQQSSPPTSAASTASAMVASFLPMTGAQRLKFEQGAAVFPSFCHDWERRLHERESNNLDHLTWQARNGYQTATYTGYSTIESCETKPTRTTLIGKLTYEELDYYIIGKSVDEAKHSTPKIVGKTKTLEIFSWDRNKWFY